MIAVETPPQPDRGEFACEMQRLRKRLGLTRYAAAKRAGLSPSTWGQIENGYYSQRGVLNAPRPKEDTIRRIAAVLGWPLADAYRAAGVEFDPDELPPDADEEQFEDATFLELLGGMLPMQRRSLYALMRTMHDPHTDVEKLLKAS